jgi:hypothetical protein
MPLKEGWSVPLAIVALGIVRQAATQRIAALSYSAMGLVNQ